MIAKIFRIMSNAEEFLTAETIAEVLLTQITLKADNPKTFFAVSEWTEHDKSAKT